MRTVLLVRHAAAGKRGAWRGASDRDRPLDDSGHRQAALLAGVLAADGPVTVLVSSPYERCVQTLEPLATSCGRTVDTDEALAEAPDPLPLPDGTDPWLTSAWAAGRALALVDRVLAALPEGGRAALCSHGDVLPALLALLAGRGDAVGDRVHLRKGGWAALDFTAGRCTALLLHRPPDERTAG